MLILKEPILLLKHNFLLSHLWGSPEEINRRGSSKKEHNSIDDETQGIPKCVKHRGFCNSGTHIPFSICTPIEPKHHNRNYSTQSHCTIAKLQNIFRSIGGIIISVIKCEPKIHNFTQKGHCKLVMWTKTLQPLHKVEGARLRMINSIHFL